MKVNLANEKRKIAGRAEAAFKKNFQEFTSGDLAALGELCNSICVLKEFILSRHYVGDKSHVVTYLNKVFDRHVVLILFDGQKYFGYTQDLILKLVRGEALHGDSDNRNANTTALHNFVLEQNEKSSSQFAISLNWIIGPEGYRVGGNKEGADLFIH